MALTSLPVLLYVIPAVMLLAALVPPRRKIAVLGLGGLICEYVTGGIAGLALLMLCICSAWLCIRLMPHEPHQNLPKKKFRLICGIGVQIAILTAGKMLLSPAALLPILLCAMLGIECMPARAAHHLHVPPLLVYLSAACAMPHLWAGPLMSFPDMREMTENRSVTAERIGKGASLCMFGLFQLVLLSLPMQTLLSEMDRFVPLLSAADAWLSLLIFYCALYYGLKGTVQFGEGLALMLGFCHPESFTNPIAAVSLSDYWSRCMCSFSAWAKRVLLPNGSSVDSVSYFIRMLLLFSGVGTVFAAGNGWCGLLFGAVQALLMTLARFPSVKEPLRRFPKPLRQFGTALLILLSIGLLKCSSLTESVALTASLLGMNGGTISPSVQYLCGTHLLSLTLSCMLLFPVLPILRTVIAGNARMKKAAAICVPIAALCALLCCMAELLSRYLRA